MYILVLDDVPIGYALVAAAHAALAAFLKFKDSEEVAEWLSGPFRKTVCKVSQKEFDKAKEVEDNVVITESALDGREVALAFKPRKEWHKMFRFFRLYKE